MPIIAFNLSWQDLEQLKEISKTCSWPVEMIVKTIVIDYLSKKNRENFDPIFRKEERMLEIKIQLTPEEEELLQEIAQRKKQTLEEVANEALAAKINDERRNIEYQELLIKRSERWR
jgi:hypothetical protein